MDSLKNENRKKFQQSQRYNTKKNQKYKYKNGISSSGNSNISELVSNDKIGSASEFSDSDNEIHGSDNETNGSDNETVVSESESEQKKSDIDNGHHKLFTSTKKRVNDNSARYDKVFDEDTEEYRQEQKIMKPFEDAEYSRQIKIQNDFLDKNYDANKNVNTSFNIDDLMNMTTENMNNLLLSKHKKDPFKSKILNSSKAMVENKSKPIIKEEIPNKKAFVDSRAKRIPVIPIDLSASAMTAKKEKSGKPRFLPKGEDFLDSII
ncbi:hypothetical protein QEN19_001113 [Hanseniaspora menglaensis]